MPVAFLHLSDIHFGQEKGGRVFTHEDVRERLLDDVAQLVRKLPNGRVDGIIVTGDIAYAGSEKQYSAAGKWLDRLASAAGCKITDIQVVPGNHDINRDGICRSSEMMLAEIAEKGEPRLDYFLEMEKDREVFYGRFEDYREFAEAYNCPLDRDGGTAGERVMELAPGRTLRFIGLNSALCCAKNDEKGKLLLGARQRTLPRRVGEELVVICHHPLPWLRDSEEARQYVRSRARVFISGHEHTPQLAVDPVHADCDLLTIAAGATIPPVANDEFTFTYNLLEFDWDHATDRLAVTVYPRIWSRTETAFEANTKAFGSEKVAHTLGCPNFRGNVHSEEKTAALPKNARPTDDAHKNLAVNEPTDAGSQEERNVMEDKFPFLLLRFFRDLTATQRLTILVEMGALPKNWSGVLTHPMERRAFDSLKSHGKLDGLEREIQKFLGAPANGEKD
jgi:predicted MPP superfamily phosphohydrolase